MLKNKFYKLSRATGLFIPRGRGQIILGETFLKLENRFDARFKKISEKNKAVELSFPTIIPIQTLDRLEFFSSFPHFATFVSLKKNKVSNYVLSPAVCYHVYDLIKNSKIRSTRFFSSKGKCFRFEGRDLKQTPERLWDFTMRELIFFGSPERVRKIRNNLMTEIMNFTNSVEFNCLFEEASDPFFLGSSKGKLLFQKLKKLKYELRAKVTDKKDIAIASFNNHEDFFTKKMNIRLLDGSFAHSGCVAFGLERWVYAFLSQKGIDQSKWPKKLRSN